MSKLIDKWVSRRNEKRQQQDIERQYANVARSMFSMLVRKLIGVLGSDVQYLQAKTNDFSLTFAKTPDGSGAEPKRSDFPTFKYVLDGANPPLIIWDGSIKRSSSAEPEGTTP